MVSEDEGAHLSPGNADQYVQMVREYGLPLTGLLTSTECFEFCEDQDAIVGFAGLQRVGMDALAVTGRSSSKTKSRIWIGYCRVDDGICFW
jgi:hypothetical protein